MVMMVIKNLYSLTLYYAMVILVIKAILLWLLWLLWLLVVI